MNSSQPQSIYNQPALDVQEGIQRSFIMRVYAWMTLGLAVTAAASLITLTVPSILKVLLTNRFLFIGLLVGELALVVVLTAAVRRFSPAVAGLLFFAYAGLNGVTFALLFMVYTLSSIALTFGVTACTFGIMTLYGFTTGRDLTKLGSLLFMALIGLVLASLANLLFNNSAIYWITTVVGILIFVGLVAYDTQKLKKISLTLGEEGEAVQKASIIGALSLYLDFINLFLLLLRILGRRK